MEMYQVFDAFLARDTWYKFHPNDQELFYIALSQIVHNPDFSPERMGEYMTQQTRGAFSEMIRGYTERATVVRNYLDATGK